MKKALSLVLVLVFAVVLTACGNAGSQEQPESSVIGNTEAAASDSRAGEGETEFQNTDGDIENSDTAQSDSESQTEQQKESTGEPEEQGSRILVAYFSRTGENYNVGYIEKGNTHIIADSGAD